MVSHSKIIAITTSEGNPGNYIVYTAEGDEIEYSKRHVKSQIESKKLKKLLRE